MTEITNSWPSQIRDAWNKTRDGIIRVGQLLIEAKDSLPHGEFGQMIDKELPFGSHTAQRLMTIARDQRLLNAAHGAVLPNSWRTLYELSRLDDDTFQEALSGGKIHADMERKDVRNLTKLTGPTEEQEHPEMKQFKTLQYAWNRASERVRENFLSWVKEQEITVFNLRSK